MIMFCNSLKNGVYPSATVKTNNGNYIKIDNVQFYFIFSKKIRFSRFDSANKKNLDDIDIARKDIDFIQW